MFCAIAWAVAALSLLATRPDSRTELALLAGLVFLLGVPHGALDPVFARHVYPIRAARHWLLFVGVYLALALAVVGLWWLQPAVFLTAFLLVSAFHFSGDLTHGVAPLLRFWYGGAVIVLPALLHEAEVATLFGYLVPATFAESSAGVLHALAVPWLLGLTVYVICNLRRSLQPCIEVVSVAVLVTVATPLVGFTVFFCAMHSIRHAIRTQAFAGTSGFVWLLKQSLLPMAGLTVILLLCWATVDPAQFDAAVVQFLFVALAALTMPHMWLIERVRFSNDIGKTATPERLHTT